MIARTTLAALLLAATSAATAQNPTVLDEGSFQIAVRGSTVGSESFTIRRTGSGANATTVAQGRLVLDTGEQTRAVFQMTGDNLRPSAYQIEVSGPNGQNITGRLAGNRFRATLVSSAGEQMREYLVDPNAAILDDAVAHLHYFVAALAGDGGPVAVIVPRQNRQVMAQVEARGRTTITVAGQQVSAREFHLRAPGIDDRTIWVDDRNRVLRLRIPQQDLVAERTSLP